MIWIRLGSVLMFLAVSLGAFAAHALRDRLSPHLQVVFETGVRYHVYHALALFVVAWLSYAHPHPLLRAAGWSFTSGILLFSGSLYLLALTGASGWGAVTPFGGIAFLLGWGLVAIASFSRKP